MRTTHFLPMLLAIQAYAIPAEEVPQPKEPKHGNLIGDLLNITSCFCESPGDNEHHGFYFQAEYTNYHNGRVYQIHQICKDEGRTGGFFSPPKVSKCFGKEPVPEKTICDEDADRNTFCFERDYQGHHDLWKANKAHDKYWFNGQERKLHHVKPTTRVAAPECERLCDEQLDGMVAPKLGEDRWGVLLDLGKNNKAVRISDKVVYEDLDDMCWNCA